ncbi:MAG TPA: NAD+ synthase [Thermodesulfovibrionales bacterium]|nr:NAD+ synthase [Thermodesulfovibrionales bacterium]
MKNVRIALAQINPVVGDMEGNTEKIIHYVRRAEEVSADVVAFPELAVSGYPPEDLLLKPQFIKDNLEALRKIKEEVWGITAIVGFVDRKNDIYNAAAVLHNKTLADTYHKMYLPNYGVFDEVRYFQAGTRFPLYVIGDVTVGVNICEDIWYPEGPAHIQSLFGAEVIININASPYHIGKAAYREKMLATRATDNAVAVLYVNTVGGQDELIFDGHSLVIDERGEIICRGKQFEEDLIVADLNLDAVFRRRLHDPRRRQEEIAALERSKVERVIVSRERSQRTMKLLPVRESRVMDPVEEVYKALVLGTADYVMKNRFGSVVIGMSGGIDSSLVGAIAVDALGKNNVKGLFMPSEYTSKESREDAVGLARNLGIELIEIPITAIYDAYLETLESQFRGLPLDVTEENLQARIRGNILMAFSNKYNWLVLTTGNKSEMSVGYATLYGDMAGGFAVIKDVPKTMVYDLCRWRNATGGGAVIPERVLWKEPSAELKPDQKDTDVLPPYEVLDPVLKAYVEDDRNFDEMISLSCDAGCVEKIVNMIDRSEYKRRQSPPGVKITQRAFGRDRRFPITNRYKSYQE